MINIRYCRIPGTELITSVICMGGGPFCVEDGMSHSFDLLDTYVEMGGSFVDTANIYGKWLSKGENISEIVIGAWMRERRNRDKITIGTKGGHPNLSTMHISRLSRSDIAIDLEESLKALQTDYIDLYWLHRDDESRSVGEILEYMDCFVREGRIRYFGCSNWKTERIREALQYSKKKGINGFVGNQMMWSLAQPNKDNIQDKTMVIMDNECLQFHTETKMAAIPYSSQANGFFEKLAKLDLTQSHDHLKLYYNEENLNRYQKVKKLARELSVSISEIVLGYLLFQPFTVVPIVGCRTIDQLRASMKATDLTLGEEIVEFLRSI